ncbi:hypothetical protein B0F90DRAFT_566241 [Multifurca ochricompacta]|uniref:F-box domain-containing protein n=1 Tax=Multifurca ochricompacta TaxID=376703 RepID=A0AAD4QN32_9AGAM|nr:hypothetical protein B0F90DRAFT_566241 [Multifurca ochricompacta]
MVNLLSLPSEILIRILHWGGCSTILASQQTCHRMNDLVKGSMALQYTALLASAGLVDDMPVEVDLAERMKLLTMHEAAWKDSPWIPFGGHDGTLGLAASSGNLVVLFRLLNNPQGPGRSLVFHRLPSVHCGVPDFSPQMDPNGFIYEFFMDTSQNLLIYADGNHLIPRELGSDKSHPSSSTGVLSPPPDETLIPTTIRIYGDLAACLTASVNDGSFHLRIFNWKTGKLVMRSGGSHSLGRYEFLDADHIYYSSLEPLTHRSHLVVENIHSSHRTLFDFEPPECVNGRRESCYLTITPNSMPQTRADGHANRYFCSDISDQLIVFNVVSHVWDGYGPCRKQHHTFHISADAVLSYVRSRPSGGLFLGRHGGRETSAWYRVVQ